MGTGPGRHGLSGVAGLSRVVGLSGVAGLSKKAGLGVRARLIDRRVLRGGCRGHGLGCAGELGR
ncbi:hypothetical protein GCM10023322_01050 [Rugosimonospora acidiphila]|uniref:Uncharacterized protein n=1 Tax=Rugosimonospora acidiphila TaxID=556531 RepID=A0ABP9RHA8_9ACTN